MVNLNKVVTTYVVALFLTSYRGFQIFTTMGGVVLQNGIEGCNCIIARKLVQLYKRSGFDRFF